MHLVRAAVADPDPFLPELGVSVDRLTLAKRRWRGLAEDGVEFGFELEAPLRHGDVVFQSTAGRYVIRQAPEPLLEIGLEMAPSAAAGIGWAIGNLHMDLAADGSRLLAVDDPAVRQLLDRLRVSYSPTTAIFRPGRFVRGDRIAQELGSSHRH